MSDFSSRMPSIYNLWNYNNRKNLKELFNNCNMVQDSKILFKNTL